MINSDNNCQKEMKFEYKMSAFSIAIAIPGGKTQLYRNIIDDDINIIWSYHPALVQSRNLKGSSRCFSEEMMIKGSKNH